MSTPAAKRARRGGGGEGSSSPSPSRRLGEEADVREMNDRPDALLVFTPSGKRGRFPLGTPVLTAARALGVDIDSVCGGRAICGRCQVTIGEGEFAKHGIRSSADHLSSFSAVERRYDEKRGLEPGRRLSCQTQLL